MAHRSRNAKAATVSTELVSDLLKWLAEEAEKSVRMGSMVDRARSQLRNTPTPEGTPL